ncbi:MAG: HAMP domain-containing histidine kinase [Alphaproteobacteria bacterium]|nr:HAMP domain-containing histidine kinase [Alphaproteobacteria bacterium]MBU0794756.1 HAMP domain-containing histidine kinase [Alphaproteobacteria bacterium]MBU0874343.1 HAMP domain-containing histidine kinase [Alphaproteobacteria bacterium]MBU1769675.1 HAMP domain-containing histidine kinase [Alphaproteobacteria bacterium]
MREAEPREVAPSGSLRLRFLLAIALWVMLGIGGIWFSATRLFADHVEQSYHEELEVHVHELAMLLRLDDQGNPILSRPLSDPRYNVPLSGFYWQVTVNGKAPLRSRSMTRGSLDDSIAYSPHVAHMVEDGPTGPTITYGLLRQHPDGGDVHLVIATDEAELNRLIDSFTRELTWWLMALGALLLATGIAIIAFGLKPLDRLSLAIARLRQGAANRLEGRYPTEIAPLVSDLNAYVRQNGEMLDRTRVQAGNLAHSLRTPLAVLTDEAERLAAADSTRASASVLLDQTRLMQQQIDYQLARARSSARGQTPGVASHLQTVITPIIRAMRRLHPDREFSIVEHGEGDSTVPVDPVDLAELVSILLDNAGKWARLAVTLSLERNEDGRLIITIFDDGPGMTDDQIAHACEIGTRFDPVMPGSGLGLAIAKDIATSMDAILHLARGRTGLVAQVILPVVHA